MSPSTQLSASARLAPGWLGAARALWLALVLFNLIWYLANLPANYQNLLVPCEGPQCAYAALTGEEVGVLGQLGLSIEFYAAYQLGVLGAPSAVMVALGVLIFVRRSQDAIGLLASFALVSFGLSGEWPLAEQSALMASLAWLLDSLAVTAMVMLFFLFPDARAVPRWTRYAVAFVVSLEALLFGLILLAPQIWERLETGVGDLVIVGFLAAGLVAQVQRYRFHSGVVQRQQTKWVLFGLAGTAIAYLLWVLTFMILPIGRGAPRLYWNLLGLAGLTLLITALPISLAVSILRYRLFDIDVLINRTLIYGTLSGALALIYFVSVILLQRIFPAESQVAVVLSTLAIAALFTPLRSRIQDAIDKRFYRSKYDAERTLAAFGRALRQEVDFDSLRSKLLTTAGESVQPKTISLWVRSPQFHAGRAETSPERA